MLLAVTGILNCSHGVTRGICLHSDDWRPGLAWEGREESG